MKEPIMSQEVLIPDVPYVRTSLRPVPSARRLASLAPCFRHRVSSLPGQAPGPPLSALRASKLVDTKALPVLNPNI